MAAFQIDYSMELPPEALRTWLESVCELVVQYNQAWLASNPHAPCCVRCAKLGYERPRIAGASQRFATAPELLARGQGSCHELAAYDAAHKRLEGKPARCTCVSQGGDDYHVVVEQLGSFIDVTKGLRRA